MLLADSSEMLTGREDLGGRSVYSYCASLYQDCMNCRNLIDISFTDPRFIWNSSQNDDTIIQKRWHKTRASPDRRLVYPEDVRPTLRIGNLSPPHSLEC